MRWARWAVQVHVKDRWQNVQYFEFEHLQRARASADAWRALADKWRASADARAAGEIVRMWDIVRVWDLELQRELGEINTQKGSEL